MPFALSTQREKIHDPGGGESDRPYSVWWPNRTSHTWKDVLAAWGHGTTIKNVCRGIGELVGGQGLWSIHRGKRGTTSSLRSVQMETSKGESHGLRWINKVREYWAFVP